MVAGNLGLAPFVVVTPDELSVVKLSVLGESDAILATTYKLLALM